MTEKGLIGKKGEDLAAEYLENKGYKLVLRNWQCMHRELDIIAIHQKELVFIEVKTRVQGSLVAPLEAVNRKKQRLLISAANLYIQKFKPENEVRFDIVTIVYTPHNYRIEHIENAFYPEVK